MKKKPLTPTLLELEIQKLPNIRSNPRTWTRLQDEMLLKYIPSKGVPAVAAILQIPEVTVRARYHKLKGGAK